MDPELYNQLWKAKNLDGSLRVTDAAPIATPDQVATDKLKEEVEKLVDGWNDERPYSRFLDEGDRSLLIDRITIALEAERERCSLPSWPNA